MKNILLTLMGVLLVTIITAAPVSQNTIMLTAEKWLEQTSSVDYQVKDYEIVEDSLGIPCLYKINFNPSGFVVIAADDRCYPILGYSSTGSLENDNPALQELIDQYVTEIRYVKDNNLSNTATSVIWESIPVNTNVTRNTHVISELQQEWTQDSPYNVYSPYFTHNSGTLHPGRGKVGCVATAFAQIINYYKYWNYDFNYSTNHYTSSKYINIGGYGHTYNIDIDDQWNTKDFPSFATLNSYTDLVRQKYALNSALTDNDKAAISFGSGVLLHMNYSPYGSGASTLEDGSRSYNNLGYSHSEAQKTNYTDANWKQLIVSELNGNRPLHYCGYPQSGSGHSFVVYGYDQRTDDTYFKVNWGWSVVQPNDNWWKLNDLNPLYSDGQPNNYTRNQAMIYNIKPPVCIYKNVQLGNYIPFYGTASLTLTNANNVSQTFVTNNGLFNVVIAEAGVYSVTITHNSGHYLDYHKDNVTLGSGFNTIEVGPLILHNGVINGQVALNQDPQLTNGTFIDLLDSNGAVVTFTQAQNQGNFQFPVDNGQYRIRYRYEGELNNTPYYRYTTNLITITQNPQTINLPLVTLHRLNPNLLLVKNNASGDAFSTIGEAVQYAQTTVSSPSYSGGNISVNVYPGNYTWPATNTAGISGFSFNNSIPGRNVSILIRKVGSGDVTVNADNARNVNVQLSNTNLTFSTITFTQNTGYFNSCMYNMTGTGNSSYQFNDCIFGSLGNPQNRVTQFNNTANISFNRCQFLSNKGAEYIYPNDYSWMNSGILKFANCNHVTISETIFKYNSAMNGGAINANNTTNLNIDYCNFENNSSYSSGGSTPGGTPGSALYISNSSGVNIKNSQFQSNTTSGGSGPIHIRNTQSLEISGNNFAGNVIQQVGLAQHYTADAICFEENSFDEGIVISRNIINAACTFPSDCIVVESNCNGQLNLLNCNFVIADNPNSYFHVYRALTSQVSNIFSSCLFLTGNYPAQFISPEPNNITDRYSVFSNGKSGVGQSNHSQSYVTDMGLDSNFIPRWDNETKSICIDNGDPDSNGNSYTWYEEPDLIDKDPDGSQTDIGAKPFEDGKHRNSVINLEKEEVWNWICIPAIDNPGNPRGADHESYVFDGYHNNNLYINSEAGRILEQIMWMYNDLSGSIFWYDQADPYPMFVHPDPEHHVRAQYGYKVKMCNAENVPDIKSIEYSGFLPGGTGNEVPTLVIEPPDPNDLVACSQNPNTQVWERETWLGYFHEASLDPFDALAPILSNIVAIKAQEWSLHRVVENGQYTNNWYGRISNEGSEHGIAINYGEMVAVRYIGTEEALFEWGNTLPLPPELPVYHRPEPTGFTFEKKEDYLSVYATLDLSAYTPDNKPEEIAVFVDGVCVGAEKIDAESIMIKAYLDADDFANYENKVIEFELKGPEKAEPTKISDFAVLNQQTNNYEVKNTLPASNSNYMTVSLHPKDITNAQAPALTILCDNYPNPFNPETTIRFDLAKSCNAKLEIYNIKGQVVKTLVNGKTQAGSHAMKWNGKDDNGKQTTSGVYFYKLTTDGKCLTKKMLMLK